MSRYMVVFTDQGERDLDAAYLYAQGILGPERSRAWLEGLQSACQGLAEFPGPRANPRHEEASELLRQDVRQRLYRGIAPRALGPAFHLFYSVFDPVQGEDEGTLYILRIQHAARPHPWSAAEPNNEI